MPEAAVQSPRAPAAASGAPAARTDTLALLGPDADSLLRRESRTVAMSALHLPGPDFADRVLFAARWSVPYHVEPG